MPYRLGADLDKITLYIDLIQVQTKQVLWNMVSSVASGLNCHYIGYGSYPTA